MTMITRGLRWWFLGTVFMILNTKKIPINVTGYVQQLLTVLLTDPLAVLARAGGCADGVSCG